MTVLIVFLSATVVVLTVMSICLACRRPSRPAESVETTPLFRPVPEQRSVLDLTSQPRPTYRVRLPRDGLEICLLPPTKAISDRFALLGSAMKRVAASSGTQEDVETLFNTTLLILNCNQNGRIFSRAEISSRMSSVDAVELVSNYLAWITRQVSEKN